MPITDTTTLANRNADYQGSTIASAATVDLNTATGDYITVSGTTTITALGTCSAGRCVTVRFSGALTLTHNATTLILPGGNNITTVAGDVAIFRSEGSGNWRCVAYTPVSGALLGQSASATVPIGYATGAGGAVTQITSASTGVTLSKPCGQITTVALTTAAAAEEVFTVTNTVVSASDVVAVSTTYAGGGTPMVAVKGVAAGSFVIVITNVHASAALDAVLVINFAVINTVAA